MTEVSIAAAGEFNGRAICRECGDFIDDLAAQDDGIQWCEKCAGIFACPHCGSHDYAPIGEHLPSVCLSCGYDTEHGTLTPDEDAAAHCWTARYHVPRNQVYEGSRGRQRGNVHLHLPLEPRAEREFTATTGRRTTITRRAGAAVCGVGSAWYDRKATDQEREHERCPKCVSMADRYGLTWPTEPDEKSYP